MNFTNLIEAYEVESSALKNTLTSKVTSFTPFSDIITDASKKLDNCIRYICSENTYNCVDYSTLNALILERDENLSNYTDLAGIPTKMKLSEDDYLEGLTESTKEKIKNTVAASSHLPVNVLASPTAKKDSMLRAVTDSELKPGTRISAEEVNTVIKNINRYFLTYDYFTEAQLKVILYKMKIDIGQVLDTLCLPELKLLTKDTIRNTYSINK